MIANHRKYLEILRSDRDRNGLTVRPDIYLDETFVNVNHRKNFTWNEEGTLVNVPSGVGARLIIIDTIIQDDREGRYRWVKEAQTFILSRDCEQKIITGQWMQRTLANEWHPGYFRIFLVIL